jgi:hypothetical protein
MRYPDEAQDHLGDQSEYTDPYPASYEAHVSQTRPVEDPSRTGPDTQHVETAVRGYGAAPSRAGTHVRQIGAAEWCANSLMLPAGANGLWLVERDPKRLRAVITNHSTDAVWLAPTPTTTGGYGALMVPGVDAATGRCHSVEIASIAPIWLFTPTTYVAGAAAAQVTVAVERY